MINSNATYLLMNMKKCEECGKEFGFFDGYRHLALGKDYLLCSSCFDIVDESLAKWRKFILPYAKFFNNRSPNDSLQLYRKKIQTDFGQMKKKFGNIMIDKGG